MKMLIKREWNYCKKELTVQILIELAVPLIVFFIYKLNKSILFQAASAILVLPREVYAFLGFGEQIETGNLAFYMLFGMMFMNVWMIWKNCKRMIEIVYRDENNGSIYSLCNQLYSRSQLGISKYLWSIISSLIAYFIFCLEVLILIWIGSFNQEQRMGGMGIILHVAFMGTFVLVMLVSLTFLYVVCYRRRDTYECTRWVNLLLFGSLAFGNFYKVFDVAAWLIRDMGWQADWLEKMSVCLSGFYWISPLSWLNPYMETRIEIILEQLGICIFISGVTFGLGLFMYKKRIFV